MSPEEAIDPLRWHIDGRHTLEPTPTPVSEEVAPTRLVRLAHSGTRLAATVQSEHLDVFMVPATPRADGTPELSFAILIDGEREPPLIVEPQKGPWFRVASHLTPGPHTVELIRLQEAQAGEVLFGGGAVGLGGSILPAEPSPLSLWFIGDSITAAYGNLCTHQNVPFSFWSEDATHGYAYLTGQALGADVQIISSSGRGLWRNGDLSFSGTLPQLFARTLPDHAELFDADPKALPHAIVINLGTNDLRHALSRQDEKAFVNTYIALLGRLRNMAPDALLVVALGPMLSDSPGAKVKALSLGQRLIRQVMTEAQRAHMARVVTFEFTPQDGRLGFGCQYHPNLATHQSMAKALTLFLQPQLEAASSGEPR